MVVVGAAVVVTTAGVVLGADSLVADGEPHDAATRTIAAMSGVRRKQMLMGKYGRDGRYVGSLTTASPRRSMSARSQ